MAGMIACALVVFGTIAIVSFSAVHDHNHKKFLVGTTGMVATVILYASPLSVNVSFLLLNFHHYDALYQSCNKKSQKAQLFDQHPLLLLIVPIVNILYTVCHYTETGNSNEERGIHAVFLFLAVRFPGMCAVDGVWCSQQRYCHHGNII